MQNGKPGSKSANQPRLAPLAPMLALLIARLDQWERENAANSLSDLRTLLAV
jgi:hypothetical protein